MGPAPMIMIDWMSVRFGIGLFPWVTQIVVGYRHGAAMCKRLMAGYVTRVRENDTLTEAVGMVRQGRSIHFAQ